MPSNDVHPNASPPTTHIPNAFRVTALNVGGPHLSNHRWNRLVQEVILDEPKISNSSLKLHVWCPIMSP